MVDQVVDNYREHILDGIVIETESGELRFADAPEVAPHRRARRDADDRRRTRSTPLPPPESGAGTFSANVGEPDASAGCSGAAGNAISRRSRGY